MPTSASVQPRDVQARRTAHRAPHQPRAPPPALHSTPHPAPHRPRAAPHPPPRRLSPQAALQVDAERRGGVHISPVDATTMLAVFGSPAAARAALAAPPPAGIARVVAIADFSAAARAAAAELPPPPQRARQKTAGPLV